MNEITNANFNFIDRVKVPGQNWLTHTLLLFPRKCVHADVRYSSMMHIERKRRNSLGQRHDYRWETGQIVYISKANRG